MPSVKTATLWTYLAGGTFAFLAPAKLWWIDMRKSRRSYSGRSFATAQVHEGMMQAATFVHTNAYEALQAAAERFPGWPVMLTGHSMGGTFPYTSQNVSHCKLYVYIPSSYSTLD